MPKYLIESPHTTDECLRALDEIMDESPELLDKYEFGCKGGEHMAYMTVETESKSEALKLVPDFIRDKAKVVELNKFTPEQVKSYHKM